eukprot:TRINITY_DN25483_c0_g1_i1.p1 TRINITY_DN25483_c0_g1~~TRINITY_DN25483_c0_g1_i1.p1  ORF type:complete len:387 (-),score=133.78 TRINITY_DN25483_c0_g1_i1:85-1245(-)
MAIALALLKVGLERETSQQRSSVQTRESVVRGENNMLRLHENLSTSLYKNKDRSNEKLSLKIVLVVTLFATLATGTFTHMYNPIIILLYLLFIWILPMWGYTLGIKKKNSFLLFPWILVFGVHAVVLELFLLGAACETLLVYLLGGTAVTGVDSEPIIVISGTFLDFLLLVFLSIPLPILLSIPVKAFIYMDMNRRRQRNSQNKESSSCCKLFCCCQKRKYPDVSSDISPELSEHSDVDEEAPTENSSSVPTSSLIITRFQRLNQQHNIMTTVIRERFGGPDATITHSDDVTTPAVSTTAHAAMPVRFPSLYDLRSISEDLADSEEPAVTPTDAEASQDTLPPSYSQAEGLDELPSYSEVDVSRMRLGPYVMVYDKERKNLLTFKK